MQLRRAPLNFPYSSDRTYKHAFVDLVLGRDWDRFITIPVGHCPDDEIVLKILRQIANDLTKKFVANNDTKLPFNERVSMLVGFEGQREFGTRHAHVLVHIPSPRKKCTREMLLSHFGCDFRFSWYNLKRKMAGRPEKETSTRWLDDPSAAENIQISEANEARAVYTIKDLRRDDVPWSRVEFIPGPRSKLFNNENLNAIRNKNRQRRAYLAAVGDLDHVV